MNKRFRLISALIVLFISLATNGWCKEPEKPDFTYGNETIFTDTTWSGTVYITGTVTVFADATLTIEPGTVIMFKKVSTTNSGFGENEMYIQGEMIAEGTPDKPITFTSAEEDPKPGDWIAINMMVSEDKRNIFKNCVMEYSFRGFHAHFSNMNLIDCEIRDNFLGVQFQDSTVTIKGCNIHDNNQAVQFRDSKLNIANTKITDNLIGVRCVYSEVEFINNVVAGCAMAAFQVRGSTVNITRSSLSQSKAGLTIQDSNVTIKESQVLDNMQDGLSLHNSDVTVQDNYIMLNGDDGILIDNCSVTINNNNIFNNAKYNISLEQEDAVDARRNYWGTDSVDKIDIFNYDKDDDESLGRIDFDGYFTVEINFKWTKEGKK